jgi:hypothetical protein
MEMYFKFKPEYFDMYKNKPQETEIKVLSNTLKTLQLHLEPMIGCDDETNSNYMLFRISNDGGSTRYAYILNALKGLRCMQECYTK